MADTEYKRLLQAAKERALFGFLAVVQRAMQETDKNIVEVLAQAKSGLDHSALTSVRHFLRQDGNVFLRRIDTLFKTSLDRAMQTMYVDLRPGMRKVSADELTLIDDEVVTHQIEVGRLTQRMRDANEENIGRLNVIIAQLHGQKEAKERENPFRPYLLARALYEAIKETASDEAKAKVLFEHLSTALAQHLPGYYNAIREVFETSGVVGKFQAQRSRAAHTQRYFGAPPVDPHLTSRVMPGLQRVLETLQGIPVGGQAANGSAQNGSTTNGSKPESVEDFIRKMFSPSKSIAFGLNGDPLKARGTEIPTNPLVAQLNKFQNKAARREPIADQATGQNALPVLRDHMDLGSASPMERMTIDVVAMLFEFILEDEHVPAELRRHIGRLQVPILKAALLDQNLMHDENHPARLLLNRLSTAAVATDPASPAGKTLAAEIERVVDKVLADFNTDTAVFSEGVRGFEQFLAGFLRKDDDHTARGIETVEEAERFSVLLSNVTKTLCDVLVPLNVDKRISDVIIMVWPHVLVHAAWQDMQGKVAQDQPESLFRQFHSALPELVWSVQEKSPQQRTVLIRLLPDLVKRLRKALDIIQLPEEESKQILDMLVDMHTQVLRTPPKGAEEQVSLDDLRKEFARLVISWERASWELPEPPPQREDIILETLARRGVAADLNLGLNTVASTAADREFLTQTYLLGTRVAFRAADGSNVAGQLVWISTHRSLYLFKQERKSTLVIYTPPALLEALRDETIVPVEYAPVFERAVESLLFGAGTLAAAA